MRLIAATTTGGRLRRFAPNGTFTHFVDGSSDDRAGSGQPERVADRVVPGGRLAGRFFQKVEQLENPCPHGDERDGRDRVVALLVGGVGASGAWTVRVVAGTHREEVAGPAHLQPLRSR